LDSTAGDDCVLRVGVKDSGIGISAEQQSRLFESFEQAERGISRKYGGTGLGLAISKRIVELMGGRIWVESEVGKGTAFFFTAQFKRAQFLEIDETHSDSKENENETARFDGFRILLAEDVEINREILLTLLEPTHVIVDCAANGMEALRFFSENPEWYDMIFMDVQMPEMDGYTATREIRALDYPKAKTVPIIAMTANVFKEDIEKCLEAGMNDHVGKPLDLEALFRLLRKHLN